MENNRDENVYYVDENGHKVVGTKEAPSWLAKKAVLFYVIGGAIVFTLVGAIFGPKIMALINKISGKGLDNIPTPTNTPYISQKAEAEKLPEDISTANQEEIENTPAFDPEAEEVKQAEETYKALSATKTNGYVYPFSYEDELKQTKIAHGEFLGFAEMVAGLSTKSEEYQIIRSNYYYDFLLYLCGYSTNVTRASLSILDGEDTKIVGAVNYKRFVNIDGSYTNGAETLKILEELAKNVYDAYNSDWETFKKEAEIFQSFVAALYPESRNVWNGIQFTSRTMIKNHVLADYLINEALACLQAIGNRTQVEGKIIVTPENKCFTTIALADDLQSPNYTVTPDDEEKDSSCAVGTRVNEYSYRNTTNVYAQMDTYYLSSGYAPESTPSPTPSVSPVPTLKP